VKAFVSYSRIDAKETANVIHEYLTNYGHHEVFLDTTDIRGGDEWWNTIQNAISDCDIFIIIVTPSALYRSEVEKEVEIAKNLNKKIIPCIAKDYVDENEIKWGLNRYQGYYYESDSKLAMHLHKMIKCEAKNLGKILDGVTTKIKTDYQSASSENQNLTEIESTQSLLERAKDLEEIGQYTKALKAYEEAIKINPYNFDVYYNKGLLHYKMEDFENAFEILDKATEINWKHKDVWYHLGNVLEKLGRNNEALNAYNTVLHIDSKNINSLTAKANILLKLVMHKEALETYDEILKLNPTNTDAKRNKEEVEKEVKNQEFTSLINEIQSKIQNNDYLNAIELCDQAMEINEDNLLLDIYKGDSLYGLKRYEEAIQSYDNALEKNPQNSDVLNKRKIVQLQLDAKFAKQNKDKEMTDKMTQGNVFFNQGKYQQALECFDEVLNIYPNHATVNDKKKLVLEYLSKEKTLSSYNNKLKLPIKKYNFIKSWGINGCEDGQFDGPIGIAIDSSGYVYVCDWHNGRIQKFNRNGNFIVKWGESSVRFLKIDGTFRGPGGIAIDSSGYVYVSDTLNNRIQKFDSDGNFITKWGSPGSGDGEFYRPFGISIDLSSGYVYIVDSLNLRIQKFDSDGNFITKWGSPGIGDGEFTKRSEKANTYGPKCIALDSEGNVYVSDSANDRIQKFDSNGKFITKWGSPGSGDGEFYRPFGITVDSKLSYVYVSDFSNHRIQKFDSDGNFITKWGSPGIGDGQFKSPYGIALDSKGYVYVSDFNNNRIQVFAPAT
jgi:DNA-binding beta-propeller fold protein YncE